MDSAGFADVDEAYALVESALAAIARVRDGQFWKLIPEHQLEFGRRLEMLARTVYAAQLHQTGEIDTSGLAATRSCSSTAALLRQAFTISAGDAAARVRAARQILPREMPSGAVAPPLLPELTEAVDGGCVGAEHVRIVVDTMAKVPADVPAGVRARCEAALVDTAMDCDPNYLGHAAQRILDRADPDGKLDDTTPASKTELHLGMRNSRTGLTAIKGQLDDDGVEVVRKAIDGLSAPRPEADDLPDIRPAANRRASALVEALRRFLDAGLGPVQGAERPHVTVTMQWDALTGLISNAGFDSGALISPAQARKFLCDAQVIPMILGSNSEVLDVGRSMRSFPAHIRRAITARDRGCVWPGCDRPPDWCDAHHIQFWHRDFGETSYENGCLVCPFHHTEIHKQEWAIRLGSDGIPELVPPRWIDPAQKPRRNTLRRFDGP